MRMAKLIGIGTSVLIAAAPALTDELRIDACADAEAAAGTPERFESYCQERGVSPIPADPMTLAAFVGYVGSTYSVSTLGTRIP